ncbi:hypothetical protein D1B31_18000 [Neobacillus notoginsengisoli]|uniref:Uncharacterized protein n=1 Tax=Neobacillus notoginsengisoli TaxID=1578198 RepID=A0A417YQ70_9BACI|nr:hypothetical protein [Neobacillus notoginsengisoli]RHW35982.1 hypothetical protein D1B31_18000 [Neobacillus notoginsengisoli]
MKIELTKLEKNLQEFKVTEQSKHSDWGVSKVIQYIWNHTDTRAVNFNSFTLDDGLRAFYEFYTLPHSDDELTAADELAIKGNMWEINANIENTLYALVKCNNKVFEEDDTDFI